CDLDGTAALFNVIDKTGDTIITHANVHARNPYDASTSDQDAPNEPVIATLEAFHKEEHKIIFCSGREDVYRGQTEKFLNKNVSFDYKLYMRQTGDHR